MGIIQTVLAFLRVLLVGRAALAAENLALQHQLAVLQRSAKGPKPSASAERPEFAGGRDPWRRPGGAGQGRPERGRPRADGAQAPRRAQGDRPPARRPQDARRWPTSADRRRFGVPPPRTSGRRCSMRARLGQDALPIADLQEVFLPSLLKGRSHVVSDGNARHLCVPIDACHVVRVEP